MLLHGDNNTRPRPLVHLLCLEDLTFICARPTLFRSASTGLSLPGTGVCETSYAAAPLPKVSLGCMLDGNVQSAAGKKHSLYSIELDAAVIFLVSLLLFVWAGSWLKLIHWFGIPFSNESTRSNIKEAQSAPRNQFYLELWDRRAFTKWRRPTNTSDQSVRYGSECIKC